MTPDPFPRDKTHSNFKSSTPIHTELAYTKIVYSLKKLKA
jgi:hypothetical protein